MAKHHWGKKNLLNARDHTIQSVESYLQQKEL
jgi:hypothetical protein